MSYEAEATSVRPRSFDVRPIAALAVSLLALAGIGCGDTANGGDSGAGGTNGTGGIQGSGNNTLQGACESWCTDPSCVSIHFTDDFDMCMIGCTTEQHTSPTCDAPYANYISCLADAGCVTQCTDDLLDWGFCENGDIDPGDDNGSAESLTKVCQRGCATPGCEAIFIGSGDPCLVTCLSPGNRGCEDTYKAFMQCKADSACSDACREEGLAFSECSRN